MDCFLLEGVELEGVFLGQGFSCEGRAFVASGEVDFMDAAGLFTDGFDGDVFESVGCVFVFAVGVLFGEVEGLVEVLAFGGRRFGGGRVGPLWGFEDVEGVFFLHC